MQLGFNKDMIIEDEYSKKVLDIFGFNVSGKDITKLLYEDVESSKFLKSTITFI